MNIRTYEEIQDRIRQSEMILLYFGAETCSVCHSMKPKVREIVSKHPNIEKIEIDVAENTEIAGKFQIFTIPAILFFIDGKETIREARYFSMEQIEEKIERYYQMYYE